MMNINAVIIGSGILAMLITIYFLSEGIIRRQKAKTMADLADQAEQPNETQLTGLQKTIHPLEGAGKKIASPKMLRKMEGDLYWANFMGKWQGWTPVQVITLQLFAAIIGAVVGVVIFHKLLFVVALVVMGWVLPQSNINGIAQRTRRQFTSQLIEYLQLVAATMAANVSMETAFIRTSESESLPGKWVRNVIKMAQGRSIPDQIMDEAEKSRLPELISLAEQIGQMKKGASQQQLLDDLTKQLVDDYLATTELRVASVGTSTLIPIILLYFIPFIVVILVVLAYPTIQMFG